MIDGKAIYVVLEVPTISDLKSTAIVEVLPFPTIEFGTLMYPEDTVPAFLEFVGGFYVPLDLRTYHDCISQKVCTGVQPPRRVKKRMIVQ